MPKQNLHKVINEITAIDTHTHLGNEWIPQKFDAMEYARRLIVREYAYLHLLSAGAGKVMEKNLPLNEEISELAPYLDSIKATGTYSMTLDALSDLYGFDGDFRNKRKVQKLIDRILAEYKYGEHIKWSELFAKSNIELALKNVELPYFDYLDSLPKDYRYVERKLFRATPRVDSFLYGIFDIHESEVMDIMSPHITKALDGTMKTLGQYPATFKQYLDFVEACIEYNKRRGAVGMKLTIAYARSLRFEETPEKDAQRIFDNRNKITKTTEAIPFQNFIMRYILDLLAKYNLPLQIHTGLQSGNDVNMPDCSPTTMANVFRDKRFKDVKFMILHGGYPYTGETGVLARTFANVYLDFTWMVMLSPLACARCLSEWLQLVPSNKLMHGTDVHTAEDMYSISKRIRKVLAEVLGDFVKNWNLKEKDAIRIANQILRDNAIEVYSLK